MIQNCASVKDNIEESRVAAKYMTTVGTQKYVHLLGQKKVKVERKIKEELKH